MSAYGTLPTDRRRSLILDLVAKYNYKILSANDGLVGIAVLKMIKVERLYFAHWSLSLSVANVPFAEIAIGFLIAIKFNKAVYKSAVYKLKYNETY
jgi:hypothetical protein